MYISTGLVIFFFICLWQIGRGQERQSLKIEAFTDKKKKAILEQKERREDKVADAFATIIVFLLKAIIWCAVLLISLFVLPHYSFIACLVGLGFWLYLTVRWVTSPQERKEGTKEMKEGLSGLFQQNERGKRGYQLKLKEHQEFIILFSIAVITIIIMGMIWE